MRGILLLNVGTPDSPAVADVKRYLQEFLTDKEVIRGPWFVRNILFKRFIVPRRAPHSAEKYKSIWTAKGSPLLYHSLSIKAKMQEALGASFKVELGMRYGNPSIGAAINSLLGSQVTEIIIVPLFPQYAEATTKTSVNKALEILADKAPGLPRKVTGDFYGDGAYVDLLAEKIQSHRKGNHLLFSFHGLPVSHLKGQQACYQKTNCCDEYSMNNSRCYRAQCLQTAKSVAQKLGLASNEWSVSFQSRLGPVKWIEPYTDKVIVQLAANQFSQNLDVFAPAFVVDGLETLEELCLEGAEQFSHNGGKSFNYIPCLNDDGPWIQWLSRFVQT